MSDQPRLLFCCFDVLPGPHAVSRRLAQYLTAIGDRFEVSILSAKTTDHSHIERYHGARLMRVPVGTGDLMSRMQTFDRAVRRQLESEEYVLAHFFDPISGYALCEQREKYGYRLVYDALTFPSVELPSQQPKLDNEKRLLAKTRRQELYCLMTAHAVVTGSPTTWQYIVDQGVPADQVRILRAPVDLAAYTTEELGRPDAQPMRLLYLGSSMPWQGVSTLLRALQLAMRHVDVRLTIAGPKHPVWTPALGELVAELKLKGKVEFAGPVPHAELPRLVATCDVGVLPLEDGPRNRTQGSALAKLGEYLAGGRPVLSTDLPVARELVPDAAAIFVPPGDVKAMADAIVALSRDPRRRVKLGEAARAAAIAVDAAHVRAQLVALYAELTGALEPRTPPAEDEPTNAGPALAAPTPPPPAVDKEEVSTGVEDLHEALASIEPSDQYHRLPPPVPSAPGAHPVAGGNRVTAKIPAIAAPAPPPPAADHPGVAGVGGRQRITAKIPVQHLPEDAPEAPAPARPSAKPPVKAPTPAPRSAGGASTGGRPVSRPVAAVPSTPTRPAPAEARPAPRPSMPAAAPAGLSSGPRSSATRTTPVLASTPAAREPLPPARVASAPLAESEPTAVGAAIGVEATAVLPAPVLPVPSQPPPQAAPKAAPKAAVADDEPPELADDEVMAAGDEDPELITDANVAVVPEQPAAEPEEAEPDAEELASPGVLPSALEPWFAQLAHGYCPPETSEAVRPPPPTNFPGRDPP